MDPQWSALADVPGNGIDLPSGAGTPERQIAQEPHDMETSTELPKHKRAFCAERVYAEQVMHEHTDLRARPPPCIQQRPVKAVSFTHARVSQQFKNGLSLAKLLGDLRRGRVNPAVDSRLQLDVCQLRGKIRSLNNRRLWVLKEFQREQDEKGSKICVSVNVHPLCRGTAKFIQDLCQERTSSTSQSAVHPEAREARATLRDISIEREGVRDWALLEFAEIQSQVPVSDLTCIGAAPQPEAKRRRISQAAPSAAGLKQDTADVRDCFSGSVVDVVKFGSKLHVVDRELFNTLEGFQFRRVEKVRVIPMCPWTSKLVLANSSRNDGKSVEVRGTIAQDGEWTLGHIVELLLELANHLWQSPQAPRIYQILAASRLLGERCALISAMRSPELQTSQSIWPFLQHLMKVQPYSFQRAVPACRYLCRTSAGALDSTNVLGTEQLLNLVSSASNVLASGQADVTDASWDCMPLVPSSKELRTQKTNILPDGRRRYTTSRTLPVVRQVGGYKSLGAYLDTYFRLLREVGGASLESERCSACDDDGDGCHTCALFAAEILAVLQ